MSHTTPLEVALAPEDWAVATWRPRVPRPRSPAAPFDRAACLARLRRLAITPYGASDWSRAGLADTLSPPEAHFWFLAMTDPSRTGRNGPAFDELEETPLTGVVGRAEAQQRLRGRAGYLSPLVVVPLAHLFPPAGLLDLILDEQLYVVDPYTVPHHQIAALQVALLDGIRLYARPYWTEAEMDEARQAARARVPSSLWTQTAAPTLEQSMAYRLAGLLGMHRELLSVVSSWPDNLFPPRGSYEEWRRSPREIVFALGDPWLVEQHVRRLKLYLRTEAEARSWLAHTEAKALDWVVTSIGMLSGQPARKLVEALCLVRSPAAARPLLELRLGGQSCPALRAWFSSEVGHAVAGLLPLAAGRGRLADAARGYLRDARRRGGESVIEAQLSSLDEAAARRVRQGVFAITEVEYPPIDESTSPPWLRQAMMQLPPLPPGDVPEWLALDDLPPLVVAGRALTAAQTRATVRAAEACKLDAPAVLLSSLRTHVAAEFREAFAWAAVEQWRSAGSPPRDEWVLHLVGFLGGDESALRLASLVRDAVGHAGRRRATRAVDCLVAIGSSMAMQQLASVGRQTRSRPLREYARSLVEQLAQARGISRAELEDMAVPSLGFEGGRSPVFDFGSRRFEAVLAPGPRLLLRDGGGAVREDLPAPNQSDDGPSARRAVAEWRLLRRSLKEAVKEQVARLERGMVSGQRWGLRPFRDRILGHPLLSRLARLLLWGGYDDRGRLAAAFRVNDEGAFVDADENPVGLRDVNSVRVVHPVELADAARQAWLMAWRDHELVPPFAQLGRALHPLADEERLAKALTCCRGRRVSALTLASAVKGRDWQAAFVADCRHGEAHRKPFAAWGVTAVLHHKNVGQYAYPDRRAEQELWAAFFFRGAADEVSFDAASAMPWGEVPDLPRCEVRELMAALYAKGREPEA